MDREIWLRLKDLCLNKYSYWDTTTKRGCFLISLPNMPEAEKLLGRKIEINQEQARAAVSYCKPLEEELQLNLRKGRGEILVTEKTEVFAITTYQRGDEHTEYVPRALVKSVWETIQKYPTTEYIHNERVARNIVKKLDIKEFNTHGDDKDDFKNFNWKYFFGHRGKEGANRGYFVYYYAPLKVLQAKRLIKHFYGGTIRRIADNYDFDQTQLDFKTLITQERKRDDEIL